MLTDSGELRMEHAFLLLGFYGLNPLHQGPQNRREERKGLPNRRWGSRPGESSGWCPVQGGQGWGQAALSRLPAPAPF